MQRIPAGARYTWENPRQSPGGEEAEDIALISSARYKQSYFSRSEPEPEPEPEPKPWKSINIAGVYI